MKKDIALAVLIIALLPGYETVSAQKPLYTAPLGIQTYTFRKTLPNNVAAVLDSIKIMGFTEIEGGDDQKDPAAFRKLCEERGMKIVSTGANYNQLTRSRGSLDSVISGVKALGAKYLMCAWIPHANGHFNFENAKKAVDDFNAAGKTLKENGITLCYHTHGYEFQPYENGTLLDYLIRNTKPEYVSFEMDVFWIQFGGGDPVELLKKYGNRWKLMHLKDMRKGIPKDLTGGTSTENDVPLGTGELNIPEILKEAKKIGVSHYFIEDESSNVYTQVPQSIKYLQGLKEYK